MKTMETNKPAYVIKQTRSFYGPTESRSLVTGDDLGAMTFATRADAQEHIDKLDAAVYHLASNEAGRPEYAIRATKALPAYLLNQL